MSETKRSGIVIDSGSGSCKIGFAEEVCPRALFPSIVGRPRGQVKTDQEDSYVGDEAQSKRGVLSLKYPMDCGVVTDWDDMEKIWHHAFHNELSVAPEEHPVLLTEAPLNPKANREKMTEVMFETFSVPALYIAHTGVLSMYSSGKTTGLLLESGDGVSQVVPVYESFTQPNTIHRMDLAGRDLTYYLMKIISKRGYKLTTSSEREIVRDIKEKMCRVALDFDNDVAEGSVLAEESYLLPDGETVTLGTERFQCAEVLFQPNLLDEGHSEEYSSLPQAVHDSVLQFDDELHKTLYSNIILTGGNSLFPGFTERMEKEIGKLVPDRARPFVKTSTHPVPKFSAWLGGTTLASLSSFKEMLIKKQEYDENGPLIIQKKFF